MTGVLRHRGPDGRDVWSDSGAGLAHTRLAVLDPTVRGAQPMADDTGRYVLVFNGEIYNFVELRRELEAAGDVFRTGTDTEVLLNAWRRWGADCLPRLEGMFAFALYDRRERRMWLARDRFGEKPLYYALDGAGVVFGSEIKAVLADGRERRPDLTAIHHYLSFQYVPGPWTAFEGVKKLPPAHVLDIGPNHPGEPTSYWRLPSPDPTLADEPREGLAREVFDRLETAVRRRMVADVPVGAFLSGGVDSSAVVGMMTRAAAGRIKTFSIGFDEPGYDERAYARQVAALFDTDHAEEVLGPECIDDLDRLVWHYGEPFADPSALPTYAVSRLARRRVTVSLSGDGGDELFFGYGRYADMAAFDAAGARARPLAAVARSAAGAIPAALQRRRPFGGIRRRLRNYGARHVDRYEPAIAYFMEADKAVGYGPALRSRSWPESFDLLAAHFAASSTYVGGAATSDVHTYLPDDILTKVDVAAMACSLESRAPFLDSDLAAFAASLPEAVRMPGGALKGLLKTALEPLLPAEILHRRKMGFGVPIDVWLRGPWRDRMHDLLLDGRFAARGLFHPAYVQRLVDDHVAGRAHHHTRLWALMMLESWWRTWIDAAEAPISSPDARFAG